jgi:tetratricopeptide (TPR) repeat protein
MLRAQPRDAFLLYAIAMEHRKAGEFEPAIQHFRQAIEVDPGYCYAYFHLGQTLAEMQQPDAARAAFREGIAAAERVGDAHAREELTAALDLLV